MSLQGVSVFKTKFVDFTRLGPDSFDLRHSRKGYSVRLTKDHMIKLLDDVTKTRASLYKYRLQPVKLNASARPTPYDTPQRATGSSSAAGRIQFFNAVKKSLIGYTTMDDGRQAKYETTLQQTNFSWYYNLGLYRASTSSSNSAASAAAPGGSGNSSMSAYYQPTSANPDYEWSFATNTMPFDIHEDDFSGMLDFIESGVGNALESNQFDQRDFIHRTLNQADPPSTLKVQAREMPSNYDFV